LQRVAGARQAVPGEVVYLAGEIAAGGQIFEIGASALVTDAREDQLAIELGGGTGACRPELGARKGPRARAGAGARRTEPHGHRARRVLRAPAESSLPPGPAGLDLPDDRPGPVRREREHR